MCRVETERALTEPVLGKYQAGDLSHVVASLELRRRDKDLEGFHLSFLEKRFDKMRGA
jgi:hypothetical protein